MRDQASSDQKKEGRILRPVFFVALAFALAALILHIVCAHNAAVADFFTENFSPLLRKALAYLTALVPFSFAEALLLLSPVLLFLLILLARRASKSREGFSRMLSAILAVPLLLYTVFVTSFAAGYYTTPLGDRMGLPHAEPNAEALYDLTLFLSTRAEEEARLAGVEIGEEGSEMPFSYQEMNLSLIRGYDAVAEKYPFIRNFSVGTKAVALSEPMAYTHITGVYTFFTGEMNVCTALPDFSTVFTAAHEMAHARGIAREDEANFVAFLVCEASEDPYVRYAGYTSLLQYVSNALYDTDRTLFREAWNTYSDTVYGELRAYNRVLLSYSGSFVSDVAGSINNAYLEGMGTEGSVSYDLVVRLAVRYLK